MFSQNKKQYINILKQNKQLNINYVILQEQKVLKQEHSSFLVTNNNMPQDALFKLDTLQRETAFSYLVSLFESSRQQVIFTKDIDVIGYDSVKLDSRYSVVVPKNEISSATRYFHHSGIDYLLSPFNILNEYIQDNGIKNSMNVLIYNNVLYTIILNDLKQIVKCDIKGLTPFEQVTDKSFSNDEIVDQKLYEEVSFLEIQQFLSDTVQEYYSQNSEVEFLEQIKILYTLKPLSDEQVNSLYETIMVEITYESIDINEYLSTLTQREDVVNYSFIDPRTKKQKKNNLPVYGVLGLAVLAIFGYIYFQIFSSNENLTQQTQTVKEITQVVTKESLVATEPKKVEFPNHITLNNRLSQNIYMLFDIVPYDAVLKDLEISDTGSTYVCMFTSQTQSFEDMRIKLLNLYKNSKILLQHQNKSILNIIIENETLVNNNNQIQYKEYPEFGFVSLGQATDFINKLLIDQSTIKFQEKLTSDFLSYKFSITSFVKTPKEFFDFIEKINKQNISITIDYPIVFSSNNEGIEIKYTLLFHQKHKEQVQTIK